MFSPQPDDGLSFCAGNSTFGKGSVIVLQRREQWKASVIRILPVLILIYCILQPILDVVGYWQTIRKLGNTVTMAVRMLLLGGSVLLGFLLSDRKKYYFLLAGVLAALTGLHVAANLPGGYEQPVQDLVNLVRIFLMPMTVVCFITFLRCGGEKAFRAMKTGMLINILIIVVVELLSVVTGTDRETYRHEHIGVLGWFYWANSQSAILSMMAPIVICWSLNRWKDKLLPVALLTVAAEVTLYFFGTRLTFGAMAASGFGVAVCLLIVDRKRWKQSLVIFLITALFLGAFPLSPTAKRLKAVKQINVRNEAEIAKQHIEPLPDEVIPPTETATEPEETDPDDDPKEPKNEQKQPNISTQDWAKMKAIYRGYLFGHIQRFGYERVMKQYQYTLDPAILGDWRIEKLRYCELLMEDASLMGRLFGLNLQDMRLFVKYGVRNEETGAWEDGWLIFDVENDFHGIYFLLGIVGLVLMIAFLIYFGLRALAAVIRDFKYYFTVDMVGFAGAYVFGLLHAYYTVSVLRRNNASVYMALVLVGLWYLSRKRSESRPAEKAQTDGEAEDCLP